MTTRTLTSGTRTWSVLWARRPRRTHVATDLLHGALAVIVTCCAVGSALHTVPPSMTLDQASRSGLTPPEFSMQRLGRSLVPACDSVSTASAAPAGGDGACLIDPFGATLLAPGTTSTTHLIVTATGPGRIAGMSLRPLAGCSQNASSAAHDFCRKLHLRIRWGSRLVFAGTAADLGRRSNAPIPLAAPPDHGSLVVTTEVSLPSTLDNAYQGLTACLPLLVTASG